MAVWQEKFIRPSKYTRPKVRLKAVKKIVIHYTASNGATAMNHFNYFNNLKGRYASAHFFVDKTTKLLIIPLNEIAYHANDGSRRGVSELKPNANFLSLGIELCVERDGTFHPQTIEHAEEVAVELCKRYKLNPLTDIVRHYDITGKNCPAPWVKDGSKFTAFKKGVDNRLGNKASASKASTSSNPNVSPSKSVSKPTLRKSSKKDENVTVLQKRLKAHGYSISIDGVFGAGTETIVKKFQKAKKLKADGIVGAGTWKELMKDKK